MCLASGTDGSNAEGIHTAIDEVEYFPRIKFPGKTV